MEAMNMEITTPDVRVKKGISGSTLKLIAIFTMFIDHTAAVILTRVLISRGYFDVYNSGDINLIMQFSLDNAALIMINSIMRMIGRIAFPIFCFLIVEGFLRTRNVYKYALRLGIFEILTEIPFDLALTGKVFYWGYQNVLLTLLVGLLVMIAYAWIEKQTCNRILKVIEYIIALILGMGLASFMKTDYGWIGVLCIMVLYIFRKRKAWQIFAGCVSFIWEITAPLAFIFIGFYNGKRGLKLKYIFYIFYPAHLLILYLICVAMGIAGISTM